MKGIFLRFPIIKRTKSIFQKVEIVKIAERMSNGEPASNLAIIVAKNERSGKMKVGLSVVWLSKEIIAYDMSSIANE